jgi:hypothetical protein
MTSLTGIGPARIGFGVMASFTIICERSVPERILKLFLKALSAGQDASFKLPCNP